eukprot:TRINITY_DN16284_c0_g1_i2.p1 TRINITY_DN16284_c0_g1~~TRINITY_DN16284_c0_g1_i2.p1  ORF type:complete len:186 (-),score=17.96 TRINITY_DN16284_c0_g1_i2:14-571(-)
MEQANSSAALAEAFFEKIGPAKLLAADVPLRDLARDVADLEFIQNFITVAKLHGCEVGIASFGKFDVIQAYMLRIAESCPDLFTRDTIITPSCIGLPDGTSPGPQGKVKQIQILVKNILPNATIRDAYTQTLFFDDDENNIKCARNAGFERSFHTPQGFTRAAVQKIIAQPTALRKPAKSTCALL